MRKALYLLLLTAFVSAVLPACGGRKSMGGGKQKKGCNCGF
ncbi:MAG TPA: hypothetical protein VGF79_00485 [Bacteroidia bacterium]